MDEILDVNQNTVNFFGRIYHDIKGDITYFNWTCSGFEFIFTGTKVEAEFVSSMEHISDVNAQAWIAVFVDDEDQPLTKFALDKSKAWYTLFETDQMNAFKIKVVKLTEANCGKSGVTQLRINGIQETIPAEKKQRKIEFIGDSITCGYGNEADGPDDHFKSYQENGFEAYASKTARKLNADFNCVSSSGIGIYSSYTGEDKINDSLLMPMIYGLNDWFYEESTGVSDCRKWDFTKFIPDLIVINLGTNDISYVKYAEERKIVFNNLYVEFLKLVRDLNGNKPKILCTLGSMDTTLFEVIALAVEEYRIQSGDDKIDIFKFDLQLEADGLGGDSHPSVITHEKMSEKLSLKIVENMAW